MIYLDNAATTMVDPLVFKAMHPYFTEDYGNPSSIHSAGIKAKKALDFSREKIARSLNSSPNEIIFTSGGTESNNFAIKGIAFANRHKGNHIITTKIEHKCVLDTCRWLETQGFNITYLDVDCQGFIDLTQLESQITKSTILISVIHGHNEIGTIQDIAMIAQIAKKHGVLFHTDACQSYTKIAIDVQALPIDLITINSHKIHGPKGVGALFIRRGTPIMPWQHGGGQEKGLRTGTENVPGIVGFAEAVILSSASDSLHMSELRDALISEIKKIPKTRLNGPVGNKRLCSNVNFSFAAIEGEALLESLDIEGVACSTGSACSSKSLDPSYVLKAIAVPDEYINGSIRISLSRFTTKQEVSLALEAIKKSVKRLRELSPYTV
jgi:cysteine desulfurase